MTRQICETRRAKVAKLFRSRNTPLKTLNQHLNGFA
jgi:hypothetical protein